MALDIFIAFLLQIAFTIGVIFLLGWLIALCNKVFYSNFGRFGNIVCYVTGFVGAPIHELSHALFCLIFFHRIREIKLFQISDDGTMGYVIHSYNRRNMYQRIGNFFIGVAPYFSDVGTALPACLGTSARIYKRYRRIFPLEYE